MENINEVLNIILPLLIFFQWYTNRVREDTIKNGLFGIRRMIERMKTSDPAITNKADDLIDSLDAALATLGARRPFEEGRQKVLSAISKRFQADSEKTLEILPNQ